MALPHFIEKRLLQWSNDLIARRDQSVPPLKQLERCKIISHRGDHHDVPVNENTLAAFERAAKAGVWGTELDIRWTADKQPVVFHDIDLWRVYGQRLKIADFSSKALKRSFPAIPSLSDVVDRFGKRLHLMVELKMQVWPEPKIQGQRLEKALSPLVPCKDYHLLCSHPRGFESLENLPPNAMVAISEYWPNIRSRQIRNRPWGGLCGHYLLLSDTTVRAHHHCGQMVGTGYVQSPNCMFREINRGIDWIFTNDALGLQRIVDGLLQTGR